MSRGKHSPSIWPHTEDTILIASHHTNSLCRAQKHLHDQTTSDQTATYHNIFFPIAVNDTWVRKSLQKLDMGREISLILFLKISATAAQNFLTLMSSFFVFVGFFLICSCFRLA